MKLACADVFYFVICISVFHNCLFDVSCALGPLCVSCSLSLTSQ